MSELATRAKELANEITQHSLDCLVDVCEQALLAERRLAKLEDAEMVEGWVLPFLEEPIGDKAHNQCATSIAKQLREAAEKEDLP